jgi:hypothetical protein
MKKSYKKAERVLFGYRDISRTRIQEVLDYLENQNAFSQVQGGNLIKLVSKTSEEYVFLIAGSVITLPRLENGTQNNQGQYDLF